MVGSTRVPSHAGGVLPGGGDEAGAGADDEDAGDAGADTLAGAEVGGSGEAAGPPPHPASASTSPAAAITRITEPRLARACSSR
ncbi:hypothetical protein [Nocardioides sp.]|uniref:hypothetical protein n=1 Tax=Nocardioides sp. TaxID=35761 RepID=UPI002BDA2F0A|nr:hypothetical protein [Nocardioides sp.]HVX53619.1 hypothetical protein [Nocardioides sp.]